MTKLEAWQAWCAAGGTERLADEFTLEKSSHGKAFSYAWDAAQRSEREACAKVCDGLADMHAKMNQWSSHKTADTLSQAIRARRTHDTK